MKEIVVISGKGGTGKTTLVSCFATMGGNKVLADCDVDAANLHLLLHPEVREANEFWCGQQPDIDHEKCMACGLCESLCRYGAITILPEPALDSVSCEGCGLCARACPAEAITMRDVLAGHWYISQTAYGPMVHAKLGTAQENSGKLVAQIRQRAKAIAAEDELDLILTDGPPGIGCPVISSLSGADLAVIVTEPSLSGLHDLERIETLCQHFKVPALVCINKFDLNQENADKIERLSNEKGFGIGGRIAYDPVMTEALVQGKPLTEYRKNHTVNSIKNLWSAVEERLDLARAIPRA